MYQGRPSMILERDSDTQRAREDLIWNQLPSIPSLSTRHWCFLHSLLSMATRRADACGFAMDRPLDNRGSHAAPLSSLDSPHAVS